MLDINRLRTDPIGIEQRLRERDPRIDLSQIIELDERRRSLIGEVEKLKQKRNDGSREVGRLKQQGKDASRLIAELSKLSQGVEELDSELEKTCRRIDELIAALPNVPHPSVPTGEKEEKLTLRCYGDKPCPDFPVKSHLEIGEEKGILDFSRAANIAGARFPMYVGMGARLEWALVWFMLNRHIKKGYIPVIPPFLANSQSFFVSSQLPKFADDVYLCERDGLYLNPTAESLLVNLHRDELLAAEDLPRRYVAYTPCFRREAGSYGEEERGLIRVHQFNKVEMFTFTRPEDSYAELERLVTDAEGILKDLGIHYRTTLLTTKDMAQQSSKTIDIEVFLPAQGRYYEVSSCSNCEDFQTRRGNIRYRPAPKDKPVFLHTLNGSGVATSRLMAAILENNQAKNGKISVPDPLKELLQEEFL
jgi:seryl-tRNA synthetase